MRKKPNIIFIIVDALRTRNLGCYGYHKKTSPNIDELAKTGILFENAFSCFNATDPSFTSIMTGRYPMSHGIIHHGVIPEEERVEYYRRENKNLAEILKFNGYYTAALSWLERWHKKGFDYYAYYGNIEFTKIKKLTKKFLNLLPKTAKKNITGFLMGKVHKFRIIDAKNITKHAINIIEDKLDKNEPFFLLLHYMDTHLPYSSPYSYKHFLEDTPNNEKIENILKKIKNPKWKKFLEQNLKNFNTTDEVIAKYDSAISFIDENIGVVLKFLEEKNGLENTIILITSDHGESLTEHNIYFSHHCLYDELIHIPLIFYYPKKFKGKRISSFVQHVDITPTLLDMLGIDKRFNFDGRTLIPLIKGNEKHMRHAIFAEESGGYRKRAIRTEKWKYIREVEGQAISGFETEEIKNKPRGMCRYCGFAHAEKEELYDINNDLNEVLNIVKQKPKVAQITREVLREWEVSIRTKIEREKIKKKISEL